MVRSSASSRTSSRPSRQTRPLSRSSRLCKGTLSRVLDAETQHRIALAVAQANHCSYCLAIHAYVATEFGGMSGDDIELGRVGSSVDPKRAAAARFEQRGVDNRGQVSDAELVTAGLHRARADWLPHCSSSAAVRVSPSPRGAAGLEQGESCDSGHRRCGCAGAQRTGVGAGQKPVSLRCLPTVGVPDHRAGIGRVRSPRSGRRGRRIEGGRFDGVKVRPWRTTTIPSRPAAC
jgi:AhpD family alkylhydroperoxidase